MIWKLFAIAKPEIHSAIAAVPTTNPKAVAAFFALVITVVQASLFIPFWLIWRPSLWSKGWKAFRSWLHAPNLKVQNLLGVGLLTWWLFMWIVSAVHADRDTAQREWGQPRGVLPVPATPRIDWSQAKYLGPVPPDWKTR